MLRRTSGTLCFCISAFALLAGLPTQAAAQVNVLQPFFFFFFFEALPVGPCKQGVSWLLLRSWL